MFSTLNNISADFASSSSPADLTADKLFHYIFSIVKSKNFKNINVMRCTIVNLYQQLIIAT